MPLRSSGGREGRNLRVTKGRLVERSIFRAALAKALSNEEGLGGDTPGDVMMETQPASPFEVREVAVPSPAPIPGSPDECPPRKACPAQ